MADAKRDDNNVPTLLGVLNTDGDTLVRVEADPTSHGLSVDDGTTGTDRGPTISPRDSNFVPVLMAVSDVDGVTPVVVYATTAGELLIDTT